MSAKFSSPLLGYNNNVRHRGKVFHIQTEDSGSKYGHIITHLFMDGGRILKSVKTSYAEYIGNERMTDVVREMMKQQHKAMFIALRDGKFDAIVEGGAHVSQATRALAADAAPVELPRAAVGAAPPPLPPRLQPAALVPSAPAMPPADRTDRYAPVALAVDDAPPTIRQAQPAELTLDIDSLERAAAAAHPSQSALRAASDLPPPPANIFREKSATGKYRITPVPPTAAVAVEAAEATTGRGPPGPMRNAPAAERRFAPTRPASIFGQARPQQGKTIFGEDLMSDKSLDEVILSYLAEDLEDKK